VVGGKGKVDRRLSPPGLLPSSLLPFFFLPGSRPQSSLHMPQRLPITGRRGRGAHALSGQVLTPTNLIQIPSFLVSRSWHVWEPSTQRQRGRYLSRGRDHDRDRKARKNAKAGRQAREIVAMQRQERERRRCRKQITQKEEKHGKKEKRKGRDRKKKFYKLDWSFSTNEALSSGPREESTFIRPESAPCLSFSEKSRMAEAT
jgi:hypothetical protein